MSFDISMLLFIHSDASLLQTVFSYEFSFLPLLRDVKILYVQCFYKDVLFYVSSLEEQVSQKLLKHPIFMESVCKTALFHVIYFLHD